jgi:hypothetical protein
MIKIFTLLNVAGLILFNMLFGGDVSISQNMPANIEPGSEVRVTVTINKDQINGFAKLQIDLPAGLSATAIETKGASFTFADGKAKFIWMALPTQPSFKVSYTLSADASASGTLPVTARLSYIQDNERKTVEMAPASITIGNGAALASTPSAPANGNAEENPASTTAIANDATATMTGAGDQQPVAPQVGTGDVGGTRTITPVSAFELLVSVKIKKGALRGFGKLQESLPEGFTAIAMDNDDAIFSANGRIVKFVWLNLPSKSELNVSYRMVAPEGSTGAYAVNGEFGYLMNDLSQRAVIGSTAFNVGEPSVVAVVPPPTRDTTTKTATEAPVTAQQEKVTEPKRTEPAKQKPAHTEAPVSAQTGKAKTTGIPSPETGITYKVQITAAHREVGKAYFEQRHHYSGDFSIEHNEGWIKYVTGMFDRYKAAREQRQAYIDAQYNFPGPFVTAYNNGERITVQEALMISRQQSAQ